MLIRLVATWLPHAQEANWDQKWHKIYTKFKNIARTTTTNNRGQGSNACSHLGATRTRGKLRQNNTNKKKTTRTTTNKQQKRQQKTTVLVCRPHLLRRRLIDAYQLTRIRDVMMKVFS